jgi:hypothetical protein
VGALGIETEIIFSAARYYGAVDYAYAGIETITFALRLFRLFGGDVKMGKRTPKDDA